MNMTQSYYCMSCGESCASLKIKSNWFLVRHGETDWNEGETDPTKTDRVQGSSDTHLTENGRAQARATGLLLKDKHIDIIISSDLARAKETADIIAETTGAEIVFDKSLREMHFGIIEGMPISEVNEKYGGFLERPYKQLGAETFEEVEQRAMQALGNHKKDYHDKNVVMVTHGALLGLVMKNIKKLNHAESSGLKIGNAEVIKLEIGDPCKKCGHDLYETTAS
jgi:probable phosphoglycerate mutase